MSESSWKICTFVPHDVIVGSSNRLLDDFGWSSDSAPSPLAFAGAIRSTILHEAGYDFRKPPGKQATEDLKSLGRSIGVAWRGEPDILPQVDEFCVFGPLFFRDKLETKSSENRPTRVELLLQSPRHLVVDETNLAENPGLPRSLLAPCTSGEVFDSALSADVQLLGSKNPRESYSDQLGLMSELADWLNGKSLTREHHPIYMTETQIGHARTKRGVTEDAALFSRECRRFFDDVSKDGNEKTRLASGYAVLVRTNQNWLTKEGYIVRLGSDGHQATMRISDAGYIAARAEKQSRKVAKAIEEDKNVLMYLGSPAIFEMGWRPLFGGSTGLELAAAAVDSPEVIAGWDMARRQPRPPRRCAKAGSVYFLKVTDKSAAINFVKTYNFGNSCTPLTDEYSSLGFGMTMFGVWDPTT